MNIYSNRNLIKDVIITPCLRLRGTIKRKQQRTKILTHTISIQPPDPPLNPPLIKPVQFHSPAKIIIQLVVDRFLLRVIKILINSLFRTIPRPISLHLHQKRKRRLWHLMGQIANHCC